MVRRTLRECARDPPRCAHPSTARGHLPGWAGEGGFTVIDYPDQSPSPDPSKAITPKGTAGSLVTTQSILALHSLQIFSKRCTVAMGRGKTCPQHDVCLRGELLLPHILYGWELRLPSQGWGAHSGPAVPPVPGHRAGSCPRKHPAPDTSPVLRSKPTQSHLPLKHPSWTKQLLAGGLGRTAAPRHPPSPSSQG